jgi:hypothetical protein
MPVCVLAVRKQFLEISGLHNNPAWGILRRGFIGLYGIWVEQMVPMTDRDAWAVGGRLPYPSKTWPFEASERDSPRSRVKRRENWGWASLALAVPRNRKATLLEMILHI